MLSMVERDIEGGRWEDAEQTIYNQDGGFKRIKARVILHEDGWTQIRGYNGSAGMGLRISLDYAAELNGECWD